MTKNLRIFKKKIWTHCSSLTKKEVKCKKPFWSEEAFSIITMGRIYLEHIGGRRLFSCAQCDTFLTNRSELISTRFTGATGRAFLFNKVVNLNYR